MRRSAPPSPGPGPAGKRAVTKAAAKRIAKQQVRKLAPRLHVASADEAADAATLDGAPLASLQRTAPWALVDADGSILTQSGGVDVTGHPSPGVYYLAFAVGTANKAILITNRYPDSDLDVTAQATACGSSPGAEACNANGDPGGDPNDGNHVFVELSKGPTDVDGSFYIALVP